MTPKQKLMSHVMNEHTHQPAANMTAKQLAVWHANEHYRYRLKHYHAGSNTGPGDRPPGWQTGEDSVRRQP